MLGEIPERRWVRKGAALGAIAPSDSAKGIAKKWERRGHR